MGLNWGNQQKLETKIAPWKYSESQKKERRVFQLPNNTLFRVISVRCSFQVAYSKNVYSYLHFNLKLSRISLKKSLEKYNIFSQIVV